MKLQLVIIGLITSVSIASTAASSGVEAGLCTSCVNQSNTPHSISSLKGIAERILTTTEDGIAVSDDLTKLRKSDDRKVKSKSSPAYLDAVGRIEIKFQDGTFGICTGSLISEVPGNSSKVIQTASHCFRDSKSNDLKAIKSIQWKTTTRSGKKIIKDLELQVSDFDDDISLLTMSSKIDFAEIQPLLVESELFAHVSELLSYTKKVVSAGYSSDYEKGNGGAVLTYDDAISRFEINSTSFRDGVLVHTVTFQGASGGPLIAEIDLAEEEIENPYGQMYILGSLRGGDKSDLHYISKGKSSSSLGNDESTYQSYQSVGRMKPERYNR